MVIETDYDGDGNALSRVENVVLKVQLPLATWKALSFTETELQDPAISGNAADPNGNGRPNLLEFIQHANPTSSNGGEASKDPAIQFNGESIKLRFAERKQLELTGITRAFMGSPGHVNFTGISALSTNVVNENARTQTLEVELPALGEKHFYKVEYSR